MTLVPHTQVDRRAVAAMLISLIAYSFLSSALVAIKFRVAAAEATSIYLVDAVEVTARAVVFDVVKAYRGDSAPARITVEEYDTFWMVPRPGNRYLVLLGVDEKPLPSKFLGTDVDYPCGMVNLLPVKGDKIDRSNYDGKHGRMSLTQLAADLAIAMDGSGG